MEFWYLVSTYVDNTVEIGGFLSNWFHWLDDKKTRFLYKVTPSILHVYDSYDQLNHLLHAITLTTEDVYIFHMVCFLSYPCLFQSLYVPHFIWIWATIVVMICNGLIYVTISYAVTHVSSIIETIIIAICWGTNILQEVCTRLVIHQYSNKVSTCTCILPKLCNTYLV